MTAACFNLRSRASNSQKLRERAAKDNKADTSNAVNILGLKWNLRTDTLSLTTHEPYQPSSQPTIKRTMLQIASRTYDPLGLLSPVTIKAKLLMQQLWQQQLEWDEPLPPELKTKWNSIADDIHDASTIIVPRRYFPDSQANASPIYLHVFADSSPKACGAVAYVSTDYQFACSHGKVSSRPLEGINITTAGASSSISWCNTSQLHFLRPKTKISQPKDHAMVRW